MGISAHLIFTMTLRNNINQKGHLGMPTAGSLSLSPADIWDQIIICCGRLAPIRCQCDNQKYLHTLSGALRESKSPPVENHCPQMTRHVIYIILRHPHFINEDTEAERRVTSSSVAELRTVPRIFNAELREPANADPSPVNLGLTLKYRLYLLFFNHSECLRGGAGVSLRFVCFCF